MTIITKSDGILSVARKLEAMANKGANDNKMRPLWRDLADRITNDVESECTNALYHLRRAAELIKMEPEGVDGEVWKHLHIAAGAATCLNTSLFKYGPGGERPHSVNVNYDVGDDESRKFSYAYEPESVHV